MTSDLALAADAGFIERSADPGGFIIQACERAKAWLREALENGEIDQIAEVKSQAEAIRVYTVQKQLGKDAQLSATEIVRRAERGIGVAIRRGQGDGSIRGHGDGGGPRSDYVRNGHPVRVDLVDQEEMTSSPTDYASKGELYGGGNGGKAGIYTVTDGVSDEDFEQAIAEARTEENLTRANVARKIGSRKVPPAAPNDDWIPGPGSTNGKDPLQRRKLIRKWAAQGYSSRQMGELLSMRDDGVRKIARECGIEIPADKAVSGTHRLDSARIIRETVHSLEGLAMGIELADLAALDPGEAAEWAASITESTRTLSRFARKLKETARSE